VKKNLGDADRTARLILGATLGVVFANQRGSGTAGMAIGLISAFLLGTAVLGWCPFYAVFRVST
jgi:hypothetical protein